MKPSQLAQRTAQKLCIFGDPKVGKTTLVASLLKEGFRLTWVSMDNGHLPLFKMGLPTDVLDEQLNIIVLPDTKDRPVAAATCLKIVGYKPVTICDTHGVVDCPVCKRSDSSTWTTVDTSTFDNSKDILVFDHAGQLADSVLAHVMLKDKKDDEDKAEWEHYRVQGSLMSRFLTNIQQAQYNIICIAHVAETEQEDGTKKLVPLVGTVPFSRNVGKYFDHMVYLEVYNNKHRMGSATTFRNKTVTGSRSDKRIEDMEKPSLSIFFDGSLPAPPLAGSMAAKKVLSVVEKKPVETVREQEVASPATAEVPSPVPTTVTEKTEPTNIPVQRTTTSTDRMALLSKLKGLK